MLGFTCCGPFYFVVFLFCFLFIWLNFAGLVLRRWFVLVILVNLALWLFWVAFMWVLGLGLLLFGAFWNLLYCYWFGSCLFGWFTSFFVWFVVGFAGCWFLKLGEWCWVCRFKFWFGLVVDFDSLVLLCLCCFC